MPEFTPGGLRDGEPAVLARLCTHRGCAVLAYAEHVAAPGKAGALTAAAFARFRAIVAAGGHSGSHPEALLLKATRRAAAAHSLRESAGHDLASSDCITRPLLVGWMEETLDPARHERFEEHVVDCADCAAWLARFEAGERAYGRPPKAPLPESIVRQIVVGLVTAAPVSARGGDVAEVCNATVEEVRGRLSPARETRAQAAPRHDAATPPLASAVPAPSPRSPFPPSPARPEDPGAEPVPPSVVGRTIGQRAALAVLFTLSVAIAVLAFLNLSESSGSSASQSPLVPRTVPATDQRSPPLALEQRNPESEQSEQRSP